MEEMDVRVHKEMVELTMACIYMLSTSMSSQRYVW